LTHPGDQTALVVDDSGLEPLQHRPAVGGRVPDGLPPLVVEVEVRHLFVSHRALVL